MSSPQAILELIRQWAAEHAIEVPSDTNQTFADAGFDSMHSVELAFFLEDRLGITVDETVIWERATFAALAQHLAERSGAGKQDGAESAAGDDRPITDAADW